MKRHQLFSRIYWKFTLRNKSTRYRRLACEWIEKRRPKRPSRLVHRTRTA